MATSTTRKTLQEKNHFCDWPDCGKSFTRAEHLRRHALNHRQDDNSCERCGVHFSRPDLLGRHMARHAKRDEEAGGPGLGILETRKRTRRGPDGTIITRPTKKQARAMARQAKILAKTGEEQLVSTAPSVSSSTASVSSDVTFQESSNVTTLTMPSISDFSGHDHDPSLGGPISPPRSSTASCTNGNMDPHGTETYQPEPLISPMRHICPYDPYSESISGRFDGSCDTQNGRLGFSHGCHSDFDTVTLLNMSFSETHNYNWLFNVPSLDDAFSRVETPLVADLANSSEPSLDMWSHPIPHSGDESPSHSIRPSSIDPIFPVDTHLNPFRTFVSQYTPPPGHDSPFQDTTSTFPECSPVFPFPAHSFEHISVEAQYPGTGWMNNNGRISSDEHSCLPRIGETARTGILSLVSQLQPLMAGGVPIDISSPLLSLSSLQDFCDLFFVKFNTPYPLIHQPTFRPDGVDPLLLATILAMGATYSTKEAHQLAVGIHDSLRIHFFSHPDFSPQPELWILQTAVLIDCFGRQRAGHNQWDTAQLFHSMLIKFIRRSGCLMIQTGPTLNRPDDIELAWREKMEAEARKRLGMLCFAWDTQHAVLFSQSLCMSAFEIRSSLPCDPASWEASTAEDWFEHSRREQPHSLFLSTLKGYVTPNMIRRPRHLNALARIFLLHGLMAITSDLKLRDQTTLRSATSNMVGAWKSRVSRSYDLWKTDFDADCINTKLNQTSDSRRFTTLKTASHVLYHAAQIALNVEVLDLQIYAGAPHILGRAVGPADFERSRRNVERWLNEDSRAAVKAAARHASFILQDAIMSPNLHELDMAEVFYYPWCLYLATLICWAFHLRNVSRRASQTSGNGGTMESNSQRLPMTHPLAARNDMATLVIGMTTCGTLEEFLRWRESSIQTP